MAIVLIADDEASIRTILGDLVAQKGLEPHFASDGATALQILKKENVSVALVDIRMPGLTGIDVLSKRDEFLGRPQIIIMTAQDSMENAVEAMKRGAFDYLSKPFDLEEISIVIDRALDNLALLKELEQLRGSHDVDVVQSAIVGRSRVMQEIFKTIGRVANQDVTVLIQGESGTGKELIARAIHFQGVRSTHPFIAVNCAAIPENLLESELFGYRKGAFTGALEDKAGFLESAHTGTIFLDEIGEMSMPLQAKILRFLQNKIIQRVGDSEERVVDVRVVAATHLNLEEAVRQGKFREDLYFRLHVVPLYVPPLRERREDIPALLDYFWKYYGRTLNGVNKEFSHEALDVLKNWNWPGNVRELENVVKRALVLSPGSVVTGSDLRSFLTERAEGISLPSALSGTLEDVIRAKLTEMSNSPEGLPEKDLYSTMLVHLERPLIEFALQKTEHNQLKAAELLGINRNTLRKLMRDLGVL